MRTVHATTDSIATKNIPVSLGLRFNVLRLAAALLTLPVLAIIANPAWSMDRADERLVNEAIRLADAGNFPHAARILQRVHQRYPKDTFVLVQLGHVSMNSAADLTNGTILAEKCFRRAIELDPQFGRAYKKLAECYDGRGDFLNGVKYTTKAMSVKKPDMDALRERAGALSNLKRDKEALADIDLFINKYSTHLRERDVKKVQLQRAAILENLKQYDKAVAVYRGLLKLNYEDSIVFREVICLRAMNKPEEALKSLNKLISRNKADDTGYLNRARLYESLGKHKEAISDYSVSIDLASSTTALKERAAVYDKIGRKDLADRDRKEADRL